MSCSRAAPRIAPRATARHRRGTALARCRPVRFLVVLLVACSPPPGVRPLEIARSGHPIITQGIAIGIGTHPPRPGLDSERAFDLTATGRGAIADHCDAGGTYGFAGIGGEIRCALASDLLAINAYADVDFSLPVAIATPTLDGFSGRGGIDIGRAHGTVKPLASLGLGVGSAWYYNELAPPPPEGPIGPHKYERECRVEAQLGLQLGSYDGAAPAGTISFAPYWVLGRATAPFDGFVVLLAMQIPR